MTLKELHETLGRLLADGTDPETAVLAHVEDHGLSPAGVGLQTEQYCDKDDQWLGECEPDSDFDCEHCRAVEVLIVRGRGVSGYLRGRPIYSGAAE